MEKKLLFVAIILIFLAGVLYYISLPDKVVEEIEAEHNQINGTPTTLTINLYHSKWSFHKGYEPFHTTTINYD